MESVGGNATGGDVEAGNAMRETLIICLAAFLILIMVAAFIVHFLP